MNVSKYWLNSEGDLLNCRGKEVNKTFCFYNARKNKYIVKSKDELLNEGFTTITKDKYFSELDLLEVLKDE